MSKKGRLKSITLKPRHFTDGLTKKAVSRQFVSISSCPIAMVLREKYPNQNVGVGPLGYEVSGIEFPLDHTKYEYYPPLSYELVRDAAKHLREGGKEFKIELNHVK